MSRTFRINWGLTGVERPNATSALQRGEAVVRLRDARALADEALAELAQQGDESAFDELVRRYKDRVYGLVRRFLRNREDALDVAQETFVRAYQGLDRFRGDARFYTWLFRIATNLARNRLRDASRKGRDMSTSLDALREAAPALADEAAATRDGPDGAAMASETRELLQRCLDELPEHYRTAFVLRTFEDMSYEAIAEVMECPPGTVKSRLNQARSLLRERLKALSVL